MIEYSISISIDLGSAFAPVGELMNRLNTIASNYGVEEKLSVRSKCIVCALKSKRALSEHEKDTVKTVLLQTFADSHPAWNVQIESFRRKSGNVQQLAS